MIRTPRLFGWCWVTCSRGWLLAMGGFLALAASPIVLFFFAAARDGFGSANWGVLLALLVASTVLAMVPFFASFGVFVGPTHLRRSFRVGRPAKVPLSDITEIWPVAHIRVGGSAGDLIELHQPAISFKKPSVEWFDSFALEFAAFLGVRYSSEPRPWPGVKPPPWSSAAESEG